MPKSTGIAWITRRMMYLVIVPPGVRRPALGGS